MSGVMKSIRQCSAGLLFLGLLTASFLGTCQPAAAQQPNQLYISVLDSAGVPVTDLEPADVTVQIDDIECKVVNLEPVNKRMRVSLMIDNGTVLSNALANLRTAVKSFIEAVPAGIEMELITIAPQPRWLERPTTDKVKLLSAVDRLSPDSGAGLFFDALVEAGKRAEKDNKDKKSREEYFPVFVMLASDVGRNNQAMDRDYQNLQKQIVQHGITVHFIVLNSGGERVGAVAGALQTEVGIAVTKLSGGRYESLAAATRLTTLLPELAKQIAESNVRQTHLYRVTYERKDSKPAQKVAAGVSRLRLGVAPMISLDGHMPVSGP
jgi:hypothetical protein